MISLPFKVLLFVMVDGWQMIIGSLIQNDILHPFRVKLFPVH